MAELNKTDFQARYNHASTGLYKDNTSNDIGEDDLRDLVTYLSDSFLSSKDNRYTVFGQFTTTTSTTAYVGTTNPAITAYATGQIFQVKAHATSTGAATLNLNTFGAKKWYTSPTAQVGSGDVVIDKIYLVVYDATLDSASGGFLIVGGGNEEHWRGAFDASVNTYPSSGGSGTSGYINAGDEWYFSVGGTIDGDFYPTKTIAKALVDNPGTTAANWRLI